MIFNVCVPTHFWTMISSNTLLKWQPSYFSLKTVNIAVNGHLKTCIWKIKKRAVSDFLLWEGNIKNNVTKITWKQFNLLLYPSPFHPCLNVLTWIGSVISFLPLFANKQLIIRIYGLSNTAKTSCNQGFYNPVKVQNL